MSTHETHTSGHSHGHGAAAAGIVVGDAPAPSSWLRRLLVTAGIVIVVVICILLVRQLIVSKTNYRAWLIGTAGNCLVRVDTLSGTLDKVACYSEGYSSSNEAPWVFQGGIADNKRAVYFATYSYENLQGARVVEVGQFNIQTGAVLSRTALPDWVRNFSQIQINPEKNYTRLVGVVIYQNSSGMVNQGIAAFEWLDPEPTFVISADWGQHPHPVLGACCPEGPHRICFPQGGLEPHGEYDIYSFPQCKNLYEWRTDNGTETTVSFQYNIALVNWSEKLKALLSIAMMPIPARPGRKQADVALISHGELSQANVLIHNLEYIRIPLETSLDDEKGRLYVLLGVPAKDGLSATQLRVYAVDVSVPDHFQLVTVSDFNPTVVYPDSISNIWYQKDYDL